MLNIFILYSNFHGYYAVLKNLNATIVFLLFLLLYIIYILACLEETCETQVLYVENAIIYTAIFTVI